MIAMKSSIRRPLAAGTVLLLSCVLAAKAQQFQQVNLVTDDQGANPAKLQDPNLVNAWGVSFSPTSPFWVSDNGSGVSTLYSVNPATDVPTKVALTVTIPTVPPLVKGTPTGQAFNTMAAASAFHGDNFLFVSEDGTISGWRSALGTTAEVLQTADPANVYKGAAMAGTGGHGYLYAANFASGKIDVVKGDAAAPNLTGSFTDPNLPAGYAPFNIRDLGGTLYVTYALQGGGIDDAPGLGHGVVDAYDLQGNLIRRIATQGTLNSPWGLEIAPASFGALAGDLLVGNFGDGTINAYNLNGDIFDGQLQGASGPLSIDGLWGLAVGNNNGAGSSDELYFTAGPDDESHGLLGLVQEVPDGGSSLLLLGAAIGALAVVAGRPGRLT